MRQMITRLPDELHRQLKTRARERGQSLNEYVVVALAEAVTAAPTVAQVRDALERRNILFTPPRPAEAPTRDQVAARYAGSGGALGDALSADRNAR